MKFNSTDSGTYRGVTVTMYGIPHRQGSVTANLTIPTYVIQFGDLTIEIDEATAVKLGDDLLDKVSQVNDPDSNFNEYWNGHYNPETGEMRWPAP